MEKVIDIKNKYSHEINEINNRLNDLSQGRIYELTDCRGDGAIATNIENLKKALNELLYKIEYNKPSVIDEIFLKKNE